MCEKIGDSRDGSLHLEEEENEVLQTARQRDRFDKQPYSVRERGMMV